MRTLKFGIEIETVGASREALARAIHRVVGGAPGGIVHDCGAWEIIDSQGRRWRIVRDGSLTSSALASLGTGEIVSPILGYEDIEMLQEVVRAVRAAGAQADSTCGVHVHVGAHAFGAKSLSNLVKIIYKQERLLEHALGVSARRLGQYCKPIDEAFLARLAAGRPTSLEEVKVAWYGRRNVLPTRRDESRYRGLNLNSYFYRKTIEFRYFNGTVDADQIKAYVQFVLALAAQALKAKAASGSRREFNVATAKYDWRVFLNRLGLKGKEFKTARLQLTKHLAGSAAWKGERRDRRSSASEQPMATTPTPDADDEQQAA
jgi:Putative amidoligase enzyme